MFIIIVTIAIRGDNCCSCGNSHCIIIFMLGWERETFGNILSCIIIIRNSNGIIGNNNNGINSYIICCCNSGNRPPALDPHMYSCDLNFLRAAGAPVIDAGTCNWLIVTTEPAGANLVAIQQPETLCASAQTLAGESGTLRLKTASIATYRIRRAP
jgi:hypothetical protein